MNRRERKNARHAAEKRVAELEATRLLLEQEEKGQAAATQSLSPGAPKMHPIERRTMMLQLIRSGALQYAHANPVEDASLPWDLAGNIMANREVGHWEEHPNPGVRGKRPSRAAREGHPEVERARQPLELQRYLQRRDPTDVNNVVMQDQAESGPFLIRFLRGARSTDRANPDTMGDSLDLQQDFDMDADPEPAQEQEQEQELQWTAEFEATGSTT